MVQETHGHEHLSQLLCLRPTRYKRNTVEETVHRIFNCTSSWKLFHEGLSEAKQIWEANQYPPSFYQPIVNEALNSIITGKRTGGMEGSEGAPYKATVRKVLLLK